MSGTKPTKISFESYMRRCAMHYTSLWTAGFMTGSFPSPVEPIHIKWDFVPEEEGPWDEVSDKLTLAEKKLEEEVFYPKTVCYQYGFMLEEKTQNRVRKYAKDRDLSNSQVVDRVE